MSIRVELQDLPQEIVTRGAAAFLLSSVMDSRPHAAHLTFDVAAADGQVELRASAGRTARGNIGNRPAVTLLWPATEPDGYSLIVEPTALGQDETPRSVVADDFRSVSINEISDRVDPLLAAALGGERLRSVNINTVNLGTVSGWTGIYEDEEFGPLRSLVWSPEPGVVLELSVVAERWNLDETIALAEGVTMVTPDQWHLRYPE